MPLCKTIANHYNHPMTQTEHKELQQNQTKQSILQFLKFSASSLITTAVEFFFFWIALHIFAFIPQFAKIYTSTVFARIFSGLTNYALNKIWSFKRPGKSRAEMIKFAIVFIGRLILSATFVYLLTPLIPDFRIFGKTIESEFSANVITDLSLFFANFYLQKIWVFQKKRSTTNAPQQ